MAFSRRTPPRGVVIVGASSGIGLATARRLSSYGVGLVLVSRDQGRLEAIAAELPGPAVAVAADVTDAEQVEAAVARCVEEYGYVDAVVTSAQPMAYGTVEQVPPEVLGHMTDVAVTGTSHLARAALPRFRQQGGGTLVVVSSLLAQIAVPAMGAYCAAKWGQLGLVRTLQTEVRHESGIEVSLVMPGAIDTPIYAQAATYAGKRGSAPPPVLAPDAVARAIVGVLQKPRRMVQVGPVNRLAVLGSRLAPAVYDAVAPLLVRAVVLRGPDAPVYEGNVFDARPEGEGERGGWSFLGARHDATPVPGP